ncbi:MAG: thioesterase [Oscillospiraceae bacterium]
MAEDCFEQNIKVRQCECDMDNRMTPSYMLKYAQEIATAHCDSKGITDEVYQKTHTAFLLAKSRITVNTPLMWNEDIKIITRAYAPERAMFWRTVAFVNDKGVQCAEVQSVWILIDTDTKHIMRRAPEEIAQCFSTVNANKLNINISKVQTQLISEEKALYTMCDKNIHINNTVYADIICNNLPQQLLRRHFIKEFVISYHNEIPFDTNYNLFCGNITDNEFYFLGEYKDKKYFEVNVTF